MTLAELQEAARLASEAVIKKYQEDSKDQAVDEQGMLEAIDNMPENQAIRDYMVATITSTNSKLLALGFTEDETQLVTGYPTPAKEVKL